MQCPKCNHENKAGRKFCSKCGISLENVCQKCGYKNEPDDEFCGECGAKLGESSPTTLETIIPTLEKIHSESKNWIPDTLAQKYLAAEQQITGENRPITALFADISGSTQLASTRTSEAMFQLVQDCFKELVGIIANYEGRISGFRGDGLLALFGAPILHENDAERSILAALEMHNAMQKQQLRVTIGINTALMTVGEIQTQLYSEYTAYGTDIVLARRLQENAQPGQILVGSGTYRLTRHSFDFETLDPINVKGFSQPVSAYIVKQVKTHPEKLRGIEGLRAAMIGREHEFTELKEATGEWLSGHGQIVSVIGEAGIGKSRLVRELKEYLEEEKAGVLVMEGRCVSIGQPISYWPFIDILKTYFNLSEGDDTATIARKVTDSIKQLMPQSADETLPLLGQLLSIKYGNELDDRLKFATPEQIRHQTLMRLRDIFTALARKQPLLLILEDLHWSDDLSLDLISLLMDELANTPLMMLCVYRPEHDHRVWQLGNQARRKCMDRYSEIILKPLSSIESRELIESLLTIDNLPEDTKLMILNKSEGNPFFIEEVIRSLIEQDMIYREDERWKARDEISGVSVPDTIQSVILSRVDRLQAEAKYVLQCASVIGRLFKHRLLDHLTQHERELNRYISDFEDRELVYQERLIPELEYAFKHALTQEATYQSILERKRREFHLQVAQGIERLYHERLEEFYEELAEHYSKSDDTGKAVKYLLKAGDKAKQNYYNDIAISRYQKALEIIEQKKIERNEWKLEALRGLGEVYPGVGKITESVKAFESAIELAKEMKLSTREIVRLYYWVADSLCWQSRYDRIIEYGETGLRLLEGDDKCEEAALMNSIIATGNGYKGNMVKFVDHVRKNMAFIMSLPYSVELSNSYIDIIAYLYGTVKDLKNAWEWSEEYKSLAKKHNDLDSLGVVLLLQGIILNIKGDYKGAISLIQKGLEIHQDIGYAHQQGRQHGKMSLNLYSLGNINEAKFHAKNHLNIAEQLGNPEDIAEASLQLGNIEICQNQWEDAISYYQKHIKACQDIGNIFAIFWANLGLANAYLRKGDFKKTIEIYSKAADDPITIYNQFVFATILAGLERAYTTLNTPEGFLDFCNSFKKRHADEIGIIPFTHWYFVPTEPSTDYTNLAYSDSFDSDKLESSWTWIDEFGDCNYRIDIGKGLEISAANGRGMFDIRQDAPRILREFSGDFALEVSVLPVSDEKPQIGGILVWKDKDNFLMFENGSREKREIFMSCYADKKWHIGGRGYLPGNEEINLRLERLGNQFSGYCSTDGKSWMLCGKLEFPAGDSVQVGLHAIGMIDRTIYCGEYREGTGTLFRNFRIWRKR